MIHSRSRNDTELKSNVKEKKKGTVLLERSDMIRYSPLMTDIRDQYGYGIDVYSKTLASGHNMLEDYARSRRLCPKKKKTKLPRDINKNKGDTNSKDIKIRNDVLPREIDPRDKLIPPGQMGRRM